MSRVVKASSRAKSDPPNGLRHASAAQVRRIYAGLCCNPPTFWNGLGSVLDIGGTAYHKRLRREHDRVTLGGDWRAVGADLSRSMRAFASQQSVEAGNGKRKSS